ncbi:B-type cyclin nimE [Aspergillus clavatus NRRL 1]|uniref:G2/M-specific cyclin NimE n=1 Tax=Aspergillus clavatus (strain ATCC 1007 / CBS 513.65 / DSM 816 / NCTC 3887 / NRRL 1 / QM 1276 / 107) TaxID=344612 RepID=A1CID9_ASPCL|nr:G2/M-specific cyclin NimE [Aspergillus clavatus NRRL 1]EAW10644.1 G2/M-specific cyclin NimE [Aspergillus clavatus NRRL 1]
MPPARSLRTRGTMNENDENGPSTRLTRAKAAALSAENVPASNTVAKKPLQTKKAATNSTTTGTQRRRAALGDVSNVTKAENGETKETKKAAAGKVGLTSKATLQAGGGVQKLSRNNSSRTALGAKDNNAKKPTTEGKRPGSGSGVSSSQMKRTSSQKSVQEKTLQTEEPPRKKVELEKKGIEKKAAVEKVSTVKEPLVIPAEVDTVKKTDDVVDDLDTEDLDDPLMAAEYVVEIFDYLRDLELETLPNPHYIDHQPDLEWKMRGILVDWLIEVHTRFRLLPETLFLAVNLIDRFLSAEVVALDRLQLVGVAAMFIASKYEEVLSPHVANFSHVADETFTDKEILDAERHILATLEYNMSYPNPMNFLRRISKADNYDIQTRTLGKYLMEISLLDHRFMCYPQSHVAAAAMYLARLILERGAWDATLAHYAGYTEEEIDPVFRLMIDYLHRPVCHEAFFKKYASKKFLKASILTRQWAKKYHHMYIDSALTEPYNFIKETE